MGEGYIILTVPLLLLIGCVIFLIYKKVNLNDDQKYFDDNSVKVAWFLAVVIFLTLVVILSTLTKDTRKTRQPPPIPNIWITTGGGKMPPWDMGADWKR